MAKDVTQNSNGEHGTDDFVTTTQDTRARSSPDCDRNTRLVDREEEDR